MSGSYSLTGADGGVTRADLSTIAAQRVRVVGTNGRLRTTLLPTSATHTTMEVEHFFYIGVDTPWIALSFDGWSTDNFGAVQLPPTALAIEGVSIINSGRTILRPLRKDGSRTFTVPIGGTVFSDRIHALEFGLPMFRRGTKYLIKMRLNVPASTGRFMTGATQFNPAGTYASRFDPTAGTNVTSQVDTLTPMTSKTGQSDYAAGYMFTAVIGEAADSRIPTLVNVDGDSIAQSSIDTNGYALESGSAMILRASFAADQTHPIPVLNMARGSSSVAGAIARAFSDHSGSYPHELK